MIVDDMAALCLSLCEDHGVAISDITAIGIASPGVANINTGIVEYANNLHFENFPLAKLLGDRLNFKNIKIANDANVAALGETKFGSGKKYHLASTLNNVLCKF